MTVIWKNGDLNAMKSHFVAHDQRLRAAAEEALTMTVIEAADEMRGIIEDAITRTGLERQMAGKGDPGRIDSGHMRDLVRQALEKPSNDVMVGKWGWLEEFEDYFLYQENGTGPRDGHPGIEPMHALLESFISARERLQRRLNNLSLGGL